MNVVFAGVVPILLIMGIGALLKRRGLPDSGFWAGLEGLCYYVFAPALFISSISAVDLFSLPLGSTLLAILFPILVATFSIPLIARVLRIGGPATGSAIQGAIRFNTYIGLIFASVIAGQEAVGTFALISAITVPIVNTISVIGLAIYGAHDTRVSVKTVTLQIISNPLILGSLVGIALSLIPVGVPVFIMTTIDILADAALVTGTLTVGAALKFSVAKRDLGTLAAVSLIKLVALPGFAVWLAIQMGIDGVILLGILLVTATPPAPSSYVMASKMGGDGELMTSIIVVQTLLSVITIPLLLAMAPI